MAEHNVNTVKAQIQSLINKANETTGNQATNLTDGVNALVSGYGQGGSSGSDDVIDNGVTVKVFDEDENLIQKYEMESGFAVPQPFYTSRGWLDGNGQLVTFPLRVTESIDIYANGKTYAKTIYDAYGVNQNEFPYLLIGFYSSKCYMYFGHTLGDGTSARITGMRCTHNQSVVYSDDLDTLVANLISWAKDMTGVSTTSSTSVSTFATSYANFDATSRGATTWIDLNQ